MSYGILLKDSITNQSIFDDTLFFYPTTRGGVSTSDSCYFSTFNFTSSNMSINIAQFGNLISSSAGNNFSNINFNLNSQNFWGSVINLSNPSVIEICKISGYEAGIGQTIYSSLISVGDKIIKNVSDPGNIYIINNLSPLGIQTNYFGQILNYSRPIINISGSSYDIQNFLYAKFVDTNLIKYFLAIPKIIGAAIPNNFTWYEIPTETFYFKIDFYTTLNISTFNGLSLPLSLFNGIIPIQDQLILINNFKFNDVLSGVYSISSITDKVYILKSTLFYNYPGQIFNIMIDLDQSSSFTYIQSVYYVPFQYGVPAEPFSKNLQLNKFNNISASISSSYIPLYQDQYSKSSAILNLNTKGQLTKQSDSFILGIAISNWCPDSVLFGVGLNYEIKEGYFN